MCTPLPLNLDDVAVECSTNILKVTENEGLVDVKAASDDILAVLHTCSTNSTTPKSSNYP